MKKISSHAGSTLLELLLYTAVLGVVTGIAMPLLFSAAEDRLLQQTISAVEQNGAQILQNSAQRIHNSERILSPAMGHTGSLLALQTGSGGTNPTTIGVLTGSVLIIERTLQQTISSTDVAVTNFVVRNTSTSATHQSVELSFNVIRTTRLVQPHYYQKYFDLTVGLLPTDLPKGTNASCAAPFCLPANNYHWQIFNTATGLCYAAQTQLNCP